MFQRISPEQDLPQSWSTFRSVQSNSNRLVLTRSHICSPVAPKISNARNSLDPIIVEIYVGFKNTKKDDRSSF